MSSQLCSPFHRRADFQQPYRINDVRPRTCEEKRVLPERCRYRLITLTRHWAIKFNAPNLSRYWKTELSAESQPSSQMPWDKDWIVCQLTGRSPVLPR